MRRFFAATALLVAVVGVLAVANSASATNAVLGDFTSAYPATAGTALANCSTCHTSVPALNPYGSALRANGMSFSAIEGSDSDGDGFTNLQEIRALTNPGNSSDRPAPTTTTSTTSTTSATSTTSTTNATAAPSTTSTTTTTTPIAAASTGLPSDAMAFEAGPAGKVWLAIEDGHLVVKKVETTWRYSVEEESDDDGEHEVEIKFRSGNTKVEFEAELEEGKIKTKVEIESEDRDHDKDRGHDDDDEDDDDDDKSDHHGRGHDDDDDEDDHDDD